jgi:high affinity Mn2+ porin
MHGFASLPTMTRPLPLHATVFAGLLAGALAGVVPGLMASAHAAEDTPEVEDTTAKYQATYNWQRHPSFPSSALAPTNNSLLPSAERMYTFTATAHWGMRVWSGGELYFNPELAAGVPFSGNVVGLGSFTNGEITRTAGSVPKLYRQRLFLRQTWNEGGPQERVESDFNQLAGVVDQNRTVLTVGNFSILDVFDGSSYAKDPRTQFMNWANWTYASYDYAADARGYGWGATVEWYRGDWAYRLGRMTLPREPNGLPLDFQIGRHYGDQFEIEHNHTLNDRPGAVRVLAWRNRMVAANYAQATAYLQANPTASPEAILSVRNGVQTKHGVGLSFEQELSPNVGYFLRVMQADGRSETVAFTEADASLSTGFLVQGGLWGRADDRVGVAYARNQLSTDRRNYLAAGGISFFIGDGAGHFSYQSENILESFYSLGVAKNSWVTLDWQRIANPAYNSLRGPVHVYAVRLHTEF